MDMLPPSGGGKSEKHLTALRRELSETQDKLAREKRKNASLLRAQAAAATPPVETEAPSPRANPSFLG